MLQTETAWSRGVPRIKTSIGTREERRREENSLNNKDIRRADRVWSVLKVPRTRVV